MTANETEPHKGHECSGEQKPNWEAIARREVYHNLHQLALDVGDGAEAVSQAVRDDEQPGERLAEWRSDMLEFDTRAREVLYDIGELQRDDRDELAAAYALDVVSCLIGQYQPDPAKDYCEKLMKLLEDIEESESG